MAIIRTFLKCIDGLSEWTGKFFSWLVIFLIAALVYEVVARYVFRAPTFWAFEVSYMLYGALFMMGLAYVLLHGGHVRIDVLYRRLSPRKKAIIELFCYLVFFFPVMAIILKYGIDYAQLSWQLGERSVMSAWKPPIYPFKTIIPVAIFILTLQGVAEFLRHLVIALKGKQL